MGPESAWVLEQMRLLTSILALCGEGAVGSLATVLTSSKDFDLPYGLFEPGLHLLVGEQRLKDESAFDKRQFTSSAGIISISTEGGRRLSRLLVDLMPS